MILLKLEELLEVADTDVRAGAAAGLVRGALFAADVLAGTALLVDSDDDHHALMIAAGTAERRARKLLMGPEVQSAPYEDALPIIIR